MKKRKSTIEKNEMSLDSKSKQNVSMYSKKKYGKDEKQVENLKEELLFKSQRNSNHLEASIVEKRKRESGEKKITKPINHRDRGYNFTSESKES